MEPIILNNISDEVFLDDIKELTQEFPIEFPNLFKQIKDYLKDKSKFEEVNISSLTLKDTFSIKVLHLL